MTKLRFVWDPQKAVVNLRKHEVSFEEAETVFYDDNAELLADPEHSNEEDRFVLLGLSARARLLIVCHCYREQESVIRIISARKATKRERQFYRGAI